MQNNFFKKIKKGIPASLMSLLMLVSCANNNPTNSTSQEKGSNDKVDNAERVDFNEVLKKVTKGYDENFNDSVLVSSAVENAKLKNQEITVIIEMDGKTMVDSYISSSETSFPNFYNSKKAIAEENSMIENQTSLAAKLLKAGLVDKVYGNYSTLLNGIYAKTTYGRIDQIRSFSNVKNAYVSTIYNKPTAVVNNDTNVDERTGIYENDTQYDGSNTIVAVLDSGFDYTHEVFNMEITKPAKTKKDIEAVLNQTVAYSIENSNLTVDDVYLSSKVPFAYDYADKKADVFPVESDHGTHVSGIIGGKSDLITGIAPNTQFAWMKVFTDEDGGGDSADIVCALEDSVKLGVDAINMSLGAVGGYSVEVVPADEVNSLEERTNAIYSKIEEVGVSLLTAAGNEYSSAYQSDSGTNLTTNPESGTISSPGSYSASLTVASINGVLDSYALANGQDEAVFFTNAFDTMQVEHKFVEELFQKIKDENIPRKPDGSIELEYVSVPGNGTKANYIGTDVKGKIALVKRGGISFEEKLRFAYQAGAFAVLIYNNVTGSLRMTIGPKAHIPVSLISLDAGTKLSKNRKGTLTFKEEYKAGPFMSDFSSWGPLPDLKLKPEITAHGGNIYSSTIGGEYDSMSGTSMATPNTCGIVLVIRDYVKATWPNLTPKEVTQMVNRLLMSTATICLNEIGNPYSPRKQGAGLASLLNSVTTDAYLYVDGIDKTKLELGDDPNKTGMYECTFNVSNFSNHEVSYDLGNFTFTETVSSDGNIHAVAETAYMLSPTMSAKVGSKLKLENNTVVVPANTDDTITLTIMLSSADKKYIDDNFKNGMYVEGFVTLTNTDSKGINLSVPFLAYYGDWLNPPMFDKTYYEVEADRANGSISEKDKTKADMYATTPYGKFGEYYMIPLGGYLYDIPADQKQIPATEEKAAISIDAEETVYQLYTIYAGMLRGAKKLTMQICNDATGEVVFEKVTYNNHKATYYGSAGGILPYNENIDFATFNEETQSAIFANNTKLNVKMVAELDYKNGDKVANNTFEFSFYIDYEAPTIEKVNYVTEWDKSEKKYHYFMELSVSDNRFVQAVRPCTVVNNTLISLVDQPIPVYQDNASETTVLKIEITDYFTTLSKSDYRDTIFFMVSDYALNSSIYSVALSGCDKADLKFNEPRITINTNEIVNLNNLVNYENATLQGLNWTSKNPSIAIVDNGELYGLRKGNATITGTSPTYKTSITLNVRVEDNGSTNNAYLEKIKYSGYTTLFSFDDDFEYNALGPSDRNIINAMPKNNSFEIYPTESFKLGVDLEPWNYDKSNLEVVWSSSNSSYVSVSDEGIITAIKETITPITITATAYINGVSTPFSVNATVSVKSPFIISGIMLQYYKGPGGVVEIPDDKGIEYIGEYAFSHYNYDGKDEDGYAIRIPLGDNTLEYITKVIVPEGVKYIQKHAFSNLSHLEEVVLPTTARDIYVSAFENDVALRKINLNHAVKIENYAFNNCTSLTTINSENETTGKDLSNVVTMGSMAFSKTAITKVDLIRLRMAGAGVFAGCNALTDITLYNDNPMNRSMFTDTSVGKITIPHEIIFENSFKDTRIQEVTFTNSRVIIRSHAFEGCEELTKLDFVDNCNYLYIGNYAFANSSISKLELPNGEVIIEDEAFNNSSIKEIVLNENTTLTINGTPFDNATSFDKITINGNNTNYKVVNNLLVNYNVDTIILAPTKATFDIPSTITTIGNGAFAGNKVITTLSIPSTIAKIGDFAFSASSLENVDLTNAINCEFGESVFYECTSLSSALGLNKLPKIAKYMFAYTKLQEVTLKDHVIIDYGAFAYCEDLGKLTIGDYANIKDYAFYHSFKEDSQVEIASGNIDAYAFAETKMKAINAYNVYSLGYGAFMKSSLESISFAHLINMGDLAFAQCNSLTSVDLGITENIGNKAFMLDSNLTTVTATNLLTIGDNAFVNNTSLSSIDLSKTNEIGSYAFAYCTALTSVNLNSANKLGDHVFFNAKQLKTIENLEKSNVIELPDFFAAVESNDGALVNINTSKIEKIGDYALYGNANLANVDFVNTLSIGEYAFFGTAIVNVDLPKCESIGHFAFYDTRIRTLNIPKVEFIGECAFTAIVANKIDLPESLTTISYAAFASLNNLENFTHNGEVNYTKVDENNQPIWMLVDGVLYSYMDNGQLRLQTYPIGSKRTQYSVIEGTTRVETFAFYSSTGALKIEKVELPYTLTHIGDCAFVNAEALKEVHFKSYNAPVLEGFASSSLIEALNQLKSPTTNIEELYHLTVGPVYTQQLNPYYYANFVDYVGFVDNLKMVYPSNGYGYQTWIYRNFFDISETDLPVADKVTNNALAAFKNLEGIDHATIDNIDTILDVYGYYILVTDSEQQKLLNNEDVDKLLKLYAEAMDITYPKLNKEELSQLVGVYSGTDIDKTNYELIIRETGNVTFKISPLEGNEELMTFDYVRHNGDGYQLDAPSTTFTFTINEEKVITFSYYAFDVTLQKSSEKPEKPEKPVTSNGLIIGLSVGGGLVIIGGILVAVLLILKKRKLTLGGN